MTRRPPPGDDAYTGDTVPMPAVTPPPAAPPREPAASPTRPTASPKAVAPFWPSQRASSRAAMPENPRAQQARPVAQPRPAPGTQTATPRSRLAPPRPPISIRRILSRLGLSLLALVVLLIVGLIVVQQQVARDVALRDVRATRPVARPLLAPMNILLAGVDSRPDRPEEGIRSDSLLLLHLDPLGGWASLMTIPRDSIATVPEIGDSKINTAFAYGYADAVSRYGEGTEPMEGGAALAAETVEQFLGLRELGARVDYMATVNFDGFAAMIDALGGIEVDVPRTIIDEEYPTPDFGTMRIEIPAGRRHFNGEVALQYVRTRHADSDFGRSERQQQVLNAMVERLRSRSLPGRVLSAYRLLRATGVAVKTTIPARRPDALLLGMMLLRVEPSEIGNYRIEPDKVTLLAEQGSDLYWDAASVQSFTREALSRPGEAREQAVIQVRNGTGVTGLAGQVSGLLTSAGYTVGAPDTGEPTSNSIIVDYTGKPRTLASLRELLRGVPVESRPAEEAPPGVDLLVVLGDDYASYIPGQ